MKRNERIQSISERLKSIQSILKECETDLEIILEGEGNNWGPLFKEEDFIEESHIAASIIPENYQVAIQIEEPPFDGIRESVKHDINGNPINIDNCGVFPKITCGLCLECTRFLRTVGFKNFLLVLRENGTSYELRDEIYYFKIK